MDARIRKLIALQAGTTLALAALLIAFRKTEWSSSALLGGGIGTTATVAAALCAWSVKAGSPGNLLGAQFFAEFVKIGVTMGLFIATFLMFRDVAAGPLFITYGATLAAYAATLYFEQV